MGVFDLHDGREEIDTSSTVIFIFLGRKFNACHFYLQHKSSQHTSLKPGDTVSKPTLPKKREKKKKIYCISKNKNSEG